MKIDMKIDGQMRNRIGNFKINKCVICVAYFNLKKEYFSNIELLIKLCLGNIKIPNFKLTNCLNNIEKKTMI